MLRVKGYLFSISSNHDLLREGRPRKGTESFANSRSASSQDLVLTTTFQCQADTSLRCQHLLIQQQQQHEILHLREFTGNEASPLGPQAFPGN